MASVLRLVPVVAVVLAVFCDRHALAEPGLGSARVAEDASSSEAAKSPFRGSHISYRNAYNTVAMDKSRQSSWLPDYGMQLTLAPRYWINDDFYAALSIPVVAKLLWKNAQRGDRVYLRDSEVKVGAPKLYTVPVVDVGVAVEGSLLLPTDAETRYATKLTAVGAAASLSRAFGKLTVGYDFEVARNFHGRSTGGKRTEITDADGRVEIYAIARNATWAVTHGLHASLSAQQGFSVSVAGGVANAWLPGLAAVDASVLSFGDDVRRRDHVYFNLAASYQPTPLWSVAAGIASFNPQRAPNGRYYRYLENKFSRAFLDLRLNISELLS